MLKKIAGMTFLTALLIAPFAFMTRNALSNPVGEICYFGKIGRPYGIVIEVDPDIANLLIRGRVATDSFSYLKRSYRGYEICVRERRMD